MQGYKSLSSMLYSVQAMLFKAGGQVGEVPEAVSQVWLPGAPCGTCCCKGRPRMRIRGAILPSGIVRMLAARGWFASGLPKKQKKGTDCLRGGFSDAL